jgi:hypothetical protein
MSDARYRERRAYQMRFSADGLSIPHDLLVARDEGRVVFFCGAGISRARAGLPGFLKLAEAAIDTLGATPDSPARKVLKKAGEIAGEWTASSLISADRVFGLLERDFLVRDIEEAVAQTLKTSSSVDLSAHRIILDLARSPDGRIKIVTTNFDLLFESCDGTLQCSSPPQLPDPVSFEEFQGIIHLHGRVDNNYLGSTGNGLVLSSSQFGRAYLSDGWATAFIKSVLDRYVVVFLGYSADDPPVRYLLEALGKHSEPLNRAFAFQVDSSGAAESEWRDKGVRPIIYTKTENHSALWDALAAWANRAKDPGAWYDAIVKVAQEGPQALMAHERGQVAHLVSTLEGARRFSASDPPPPADWLCVFDTSIRYLKPGRIGGFRDPEQHFDPFDVYGLDADPTPPKIGPEDYHSSRKIPDDIWDCFRTTGYDLYSLREGDTPALRGRWAARAPRLSGRLWQIAIWIAAVSHQPAAVWWASGQVGLHPDVRSLIRSELGRSNRDCSRVVREAWRYIFEAWDAQGEDPARSWHELEASVGLDGWTRGAIREFATTCRPFLTARRATLGGPRPPSRSDNVRLSDLLELHVEYPRIDEDIQFQDELVPTVIRELRKNLEHAVSLENEIGGYGLLNLPPIEPDQDLDGVSFGRTHGISSLLFYYVNLFNRLLEFDPIAAKSEYSAWWTDDKTVFARLRIWASGNRRFLTGNEAGKLFHGLSDDVFWDGGHQRDLLLALAARWSDFSKTAKNGLERRLVHGPARWNGESKAEHDERRAWLSLNRIHWLQAQGCRLNLDIDAVTKRLRGLAPKWHKKQAASAAASRESRGGFVRTDTGYSALLGEPLDKILAKAAELGRSSGALLVEKDPFAGLASERPARAFSALSNAARRNDYPEWAWRTFLDSDARKGDKPRFSGLIAERIARLPDGVVAALMYSISGWLLKSGGRLATAYPEGFDRVWIKSIAVLASYPECATRSIIQDSRAPDWTMEAINSSVGKLAEALMNHPDKDKLKVGQGLPIPWVSRVEELLRLEGNARAYALVIFAYGLNWFYAVDPAWTDGNLISVLEHEGHDQDAVWAGFFWRARTPDRDLYTKLKEHLLRLAQQHPRSPGKHMGVLPGILLAGWGTIDEETGERIVTSTEMREVLVNSDDDFRSQTLGQLEIWSAEDEQATWSERAPTFLQEAWPRHKKVKSPTVSARLCNLAFSDEAIFQNIIDIILPLVSEIGQAHATLHNLNRSGSTIVARFPEKTLALLFAVLPQNVSTWPYNIPQVLERIGEVQPELLKDNRLVELRRRWNAR